MTPTADALLHDPGHHFFAFDRGDALFLPVDRDVYRRSLFLDDRIALDAGEIIAVPAQALAAHHNRTGAATPRIGWIFHIAHCGSTLLARALDQSEHSLVLREPLPLRQLGVEAAALPVERPAAWTARLRLAVALAGRRYRDDAPAIVKANVPVNIILPDLMTLDPGAPGILLHLPLDTYLLAILRSDAHRDWVTRVIGEITSAVAEWAGPIDGLDIVELAAALWLAQMRIYAAALARHTGLRSLSATTLFEDAGAVLAMAFTLFGVEMTPASINAIVSGPLFATHAKRPGEAFDNIARRGREATLAATLAGDLARARRWIERRLDGYPIPTRLPRPLLGGGVALLEDSTPKIGVTE